jgi:hypothetical protein
MEFANFICSKLLSIFNTTSAQFRLFC